MQHLSIRAKSHGRFKQPNESSEMTKHMLEGHKAKYQAKLAALIARIDNLSQNQEGWTNIICEPKNNSSKALIPTQPESALRGCPDNNLVPQYAKLDFHLNGGKHDPLGCRNRFDQFFHNQRIAAEDKVSPDSFYIDLYIVPLDSFDVVLVVNWLCTLGTIVLDFSSLTIFFSLNTKKVTWKGKSLKAASKVFSIQNSASPQVALDRLLVEYRDLFWEPEGLPPSQAED
ncbi:hypothetical protein ACH5RR_018529 [Cinchona calisaya]|uniref:Uncharacterized protein n=1 Tax=Cinchona calisaya TaxID=153742 RepID=A0ABD2ZQC7_9GENT